MPIPLKISLEILAGARILRVNGRISDRDEIWMPNFQLQCLLQFYSKNLTIMLEPFTGTL